MSFTYMHTTFQNEEKCSKEYCNCANWDIYSIKLENLRKKLKMHTFGAVTSKVHVSSGTGLGFMSGFNSWILCNPDDRSDIFT
jgi:hypothetical protein